MMMAEEIPKSNKFQRLTPHTTTNLLHSVDAFLFDCDGVIWKGDALIDGVPDTLDMLRAMGKKLVFVTNNSTKSRKQYAKKFHSLGISVSEERVLLTSPFNELHQHGLKATILFELGNMSCKVFSNHCAKKCIETLCNGCSVFGTMVY